MASSPSRFARVRRHGHDEFRQGRGLGGRDDPPEDIVEAVRFMLRLSPGCVVPEIVFHRPETSAGT